MKIMDKEQANARLMYYYEFLFKFLNEGVKPIELLEDVKGTAWEYTYQAPEYEKPFNVLYNEVYQELKQIKEILE